MSRGELARVSRSDWTYVHRNDSKRCNGKDARVRRGGDALNLHIDRSSRRGSSTLSSVTPTFEGRPKLLTRRLEDRSHRRGGEGSSRANGPALRARIRILVDRSIARPLVPPSPSQVYIRENLSELIFPPLDAAWRLESVVVMNRPVPRRIGHPSFADRPARGETARSPDDGDGRDHSSTISSKCTAPFFSDLYELYSMFFAHARHSTLMIRFLAGRRKWTATTGLR